MLQRHEVEHADLVDLPGPRQRRLELERRLVFADPVALHQEQVPGLGVEVVDERRRFRPQLHDFVLVALHVAFDVYEFDHHQTRALVVDPFFVVLLFDALQFRLSQLFELRLFSEGFTRFRFVFD